MDTKGGVLDPRSYSQVSSRLAALHGSQLPFLPGQSMADYTAAPSGGSPGGGVYAPTAQYALPSVPNLRTKDDLVDADQIFQSMQTTIYENPNSIAAAGLGQPEAHYVQTMAQRQSHSPPGLELPSTHNTSFASGQNMNGTPPHSHHSPTPDLTPPSSAVSYTSGNSPRSHHGNNNRRSPTTPATMYPTLPGGTSDGYPSSSMAPTSTLGSQFDHEGRRRYSGGRLQKAQPLHRPPKHGDEMDTSEPTTPRNNALSRSSSEAETTKYLTRRNVDFSTSNLDPALGGVTSPSSGEIDESVVKENEMWLGTARTVEALRAWIKQRLENHEYESDGEGSPQVKDEPISLYPVLATD